MVVAVISLQQGSQAWAARSEAFAIWKQNGLLQFQRYLCTHMWCYISKIYANHFLRGVFLFAALNSCANLTVTKNQDTRRGANHKGDDTQYAPRPVWVATCWRLRLRTSKMFTQITNLDGFLHTPTCCECKQEISPTVDLRLGARISILGIRICTGGPIRATDSRCTLVCAISLCSVWLITRRWSGTFWQEKTQDP